MVYIISDDIRGRHGWVRRTDNVRIQEVSGAGLRSSVLTPVPAVGHTSHQPTLNQLTVLSVKIRIFAITDKAETIV